MSASMHVLPWLLTALVTSLPSIEGGSSTQRQAFPAPREATVCDLLKEPTAWNQVLVRVTAVATHAFEHFSLSSPTREDSHGIWLTYGGQETELAVTPTGLGGFGHLGCCSLLVIQRVEQFQEIRNGPKDDAGR